MVHEVRTPLSSLRLCVEGLACAEGLSERDRRRVKLALGQIGYLEDLTTRMGSLCANGTPSPGPVDLKEVLEEVVQEVGLDGASRRTEICVDCEPGVPPVDADRVHVKSVLVNLCQNGLQAMEDGGLLRLLVRPAPPDQVEVAVEDHGCGISESAMTRVFEPYYTTKPDGMGMGLAIVKSLVEAQGGRVQVQSRAGRGSTVTVWLKTFH